MRVMIPVLAGACLSVALAAQASAEAATPSPVIGMAKAVAIAETELNARAFDAELDIGREGLVYEINLVKDGKAMKAEIGATDGKVLRQQAAGGVKLPWSQDAKAVKLPWGNEDLTAVQSAPRSLSETIAMVEKSTKAEVSEIELESRKGRHYYEIELVGAQDRAILVDMKTGAFTPLMDD